jgi:hypothetical protein
MNQSAKIVTHLPLRELWREDGLVTTSRARSLADDDITALLRVGPVEFVVVDVGHAARWIHLGDSYQFWKSEAKPHLATGAKAVPADFPDVYCYFGSRWNRSESGPPIVVLEKSH